MNYNTNQITQPAANPPLYTPGKSIGTKPSFYLVIKRLFDLLLASIVIIILSPLLIPIIIGLKLTGEGYIFY